MVQKVTGAVVLSLVGAVLASGGVVYYNRMLAEDICVQAWLFDPRFNEAESMSISQSLFSITCTYDDDSITRSQWFTVQDYSDL